MADEDATERATVFGSIAEDYARLRPAPCAGAVDWLVPAGARRVLDLAAGAGTLTGMLAARVPEVVAVEPDPRMRSVLAARNPGLTVLDGTAEAIPLPDGGLDAVVVASAWHWFDPVRAVPEVARVLRPGGRLSVVWNGLDDSVPWVDSWRTGLRAARAEREHFPRGERLSEELTAPGSPFAPPEHDVFTCTHPATPADAAALLGTYSRLLLLPEEERRALVAQAEQALHDRPDLLSPDGTVPLPFRSLCWRATRTGPAVPAA
ncbi:Ubiquinone/menaquinone biosynthesis C-methylase UbiE [Actinacidiphila yanglinensis]|uniref:Ubiquinone/menaquinone biosynthesis C-methylase UbiE n=1 Tax=Actinacidiphila yanglinensis TaxID=310779 RepID=A0A1H6CWQ5_9ACTN|nr:class I SAM-dependent methyltransferase [Actinacidiphila yanglinensis]SEG76826.1 Ubiquinone/menaquinone biosynthesis C-methylase UbiE [Actinacidiphila yanglinensis]